MVTDLEIEQKREFLKEQIKWIKGEIKAAKVGVESAKELYHNFGMYEDCGESYSISYAESKVKLTTLIDIKIKLEKYRKKLSYLVNL